MNQTDPHFEELLIYLKESRGFDFTGYKRSSLVRRMDRRMAMVDVPSYIDYRDYLELHQDEFTQLFNALLINVTGFFRDIEAWDDLRETALPQMLAARGDAGAIRVWSAGCASGEEAYTLAIILAELMGADEFRKRVKIYATDVDEVSLNRARHATYTERDVKSVPAALLAKYFDAQGGGYAFRRELRRSIVFGRNDLVHDAPISRVDLLVCRNTLMYLNAETRAGILGRFHFALADHGLLLLGKAEMLIGHGNLFAPVDIKSRVFRKVPWTSSPRAGSFSDPPVPVPRRDPGAVDGLRSEAFLSSPLAQIVVTSDGLVALANRQADVLFGVSSRDTGRPFRDLDAFCHPVELHRHIDQVQVERRVTRLTDVEVTRATGDPSCFDVQVTPLIDAGSRLLGVGLIFHDVTAARRLRDELEAANRRLEAAYLELQEANEELEITNEELQSAVQELETTNDDLQSRVDNLENLDTANAFLTSVLASLRAGVAVVNQDLQVQVWNRRAEDLWGLRKEEAIGRHFLTLDVGLPVERLRPLIREALNGAERPQEVQLPAVNRRGRSILVRVVCTPLASADASHTSGAIIVMEPESQA